MGSREGGAFFFWLFFFFSTPCLPSPFLLSISSLLSFLLLTSPSWCAGSQAPGGGLLTELINREHKNSRYLPDVDLPENLVAVPKLADVVKDATLIIFCVPHQVRFLPLVHLPDARSLEERRFFFGEVWS